MTSAKRRGDVVGAGVGALPGGRDRGSGEAKKKVGKKGENDDEGGGGRGSERWWRGGG